MPFPTRYTRIPYIADDAVDIQIDRQRDLFWVLAGGGYSFHDPDFELTEDGPNFFKIRMADGVVLASGRGALPVWDIEETSPDISTHFDVWNFAVAPSTGNLYVAVTNVDVSPDVSYIHCLDPNDFHTLFSSPPITGLYDALDWLTIVEPYIYYYSHIPGGSPALRLAWSRLPLTLAQVDWSAITYSGIDSFEIPIDGNIAVDSAGNLWSGCLKTLAKVSPTGTVTTYNLAASLNANACIMTVGYDPGTNSLGMFVNLRASNGTGAFVSPYNQIVKVNCATGAVTATYSQPTTLRLYSRPLHRAWENIHDGRVLLKLDRGTINAAENRGALIDFDLRSMAILRIYRLQQDWDLDATPVEPVYQESPLNAAQHLQQIMPDIASRRIWAYNAFSGWIYPDGTYPQGSYGVWQWSLNECASYIHFWPDDWAYDRTNLDRERGFIWHMSTGGPHFRKIQASTGQVLLNQKAPGVPDWEQPPYTDWYVWYFAVSQVTGNVYINDDEGDQGRVRCLSGTTLNLLHTSPYVQTSLYGVWAVGQYVYCMDGESYGTSPTRRQRMRLTRFPLDLSSLDWTVQVYDCLTGINDGHVRVSDEYAPLTEDKDHNIWLGNQKTLISVSPAGAVNTYSLSGLPTTGYVLATVYDADMDTIICGIGNNPGYPQNNAAGLARFSRATNTLVAYQENPEWYMTPGNGGSRPNNWARLPNGRLWLRLGRLGSRTSPAPQGDFAEIDTRTFQEVRRFSLTSDWCITDVSPTDDRRSTAQATSGYLWDDCSCALWLYNGASWIYENAEYPSGAYGMWKLPLPDEPAADCPLGIPARTPPNWLEYFHDVLLDTYISYDCKIAVKFQTYIVRMREGHEERIGEWQDPIWTFDITPALRDQADLDYLLAFFRARHGPQFIFKFFNPLDNHVENDVFGDGDGVSQEFQLSRLYRTQLPGDGTYYVRPIVLPIPGVQIYDNDVLVPPNTYNFYALGGTIVFANPPADGHVLTWTGSYYTPVRFLNNRVYSVVEHYEHFEDKIMLVEERVPVQGKVYGESESPDFLDVLFPYRYAQRASMGPEIDVITVQSDSGATFRKAQFQSAKIRFTVEETEQPMAVIQQILAFFLNRKGRLIGFRARDITDFELVREPMQAADGVRTEFQIVKNYASGVQTDVRRITKPNTDIVVYDGDVEIVPQPAIDMASGTVTFTTPPAAEAQLTCSGTFDVPVRFDSDEMTFSIKGYEWFNMEAINLTETELGLPDFTMDTPPALLLRAGPAPRSAAQQLACALPPRPAVTQYLEFRGAAGTGLQIDAPGALYRRLSGASSLTFAVLVSHVKTGTLSGRPGATYPMALFAHVMPGMGTDPTLASTGFTLYLQNLGAGLALDASLGAYVYGTSGALCTADLALTPRLAAQGALAASTIAGNDHMHAYVITMDWLSKRAYWSGTLYGMQSFTPEAFAYNTCLPGTGGADARLVDLAAQSYVGVLDPTLGSGQTANDGWLGTVSAQPTAPVFHSPLTAYMYEHLLLPTFGWVDMRTMLRDVHTPILQYWGNKYGTGFANAQSPALPTFDIFWWRADENVSVADGASGAIASWAPVACGFDWVKPNAGLLQDDGQPRQHLIATVPVFDDILMLADGRRLLARQT